MSQLGPRGGRKMVEKAEGLSIAQQELATILGENQEVQFSSDTDAVLLIGHTEQPTLEKLQVNSCKLEVINLKRNVIDICNSMDIRKNYSVSDCSRGE
ncbi:hypothetical protein E2320_000024, partial [Naja naja]